jgi:hypothetical protein
MVVLALELYWWLKAVHSFAITRLLQHLKRAAVPPPSAPARSCQVRQPEQRGPTVARGDRSVSRRIMRGLVGGPLRGGAALLP